MISISVENIEELFGIIGGNTPLVPTVQADDAEKEALKTENTKLKKKVEEYKEMLKVATAKADKLQAELDAAKAQPAPWAEEPVKEVMPEPVKEEAPKAKQPTLAEVRATLKGLQDKKGTDAVRALIKPYGVKAISQVPEEHYAEILAKAEEALNA